MLKKHIEGLEKLLAIKVGDDRQEEYQNYLNRKGVPDEKLNKMEKHYDIKLPEDFKEFYHYKDGSGYFFHILYPSYNEDCISPFYLLSLDEIDEFHLDDLD